MVIRTRNPRPCVDHYQLKLSFPEGWTAFERLATSAGGFSDAQIIRVIFAHFSVSPLPFAFISRKPSAGISPGRWARMERLAATLGPLLLSPPPEVRAGGTGWKLAGQFRRSGPVRRSPLLPAILSNRRRGWSLRTRRLGWQPPLVGGGSRAGPRSAESLRPDECDPLLPFGGVADSAPREIRLPSSRLP